MENKVNVYIIEKGVCPGGILPTVKAMEERGRITYKENKFFLSENENETSVIAVLKEGFPKENADKVKDYFASLTKFLKKEEIDDIILHMDDRKTWCLANVAEGLKLGEYSYKKGEKKEYSLKFVVEPRIDEKEHEYFKKGMKFAEILKDIRDMVNTTSETMTPLCFAAHAQNFLEGSSVEVELLDQNELFEKNFKAMLSVSRGGYNEPCAVIMRYMGDPANPENITGLLGKGVTFDSGGLSLKTKTGMLTMHCDMGGAAAVLGAMRLINEVKPKKNVIGMCVLSENMLSEYAYRPGEIIDSMSGKTILINSTDAEGRLLLCDGMWYLRKHENVSRLADIATLTGGVVSSLGDNITGYMSNDDELSSKLEKAGERAGEPLWRLPLPEKYRDKVKAVQADLRNSTLGDGPAAITAGLFLQEFAEDTPWVHVDIAGTAYLKHEDGRYSYGATAVGSEMLLNWVLDI